MTKTIVIPADTLRRWIGRLEGISGVCRDHGRDGTAAQIEQVTKEMSKLGGDAVKTEVVYAVGL